MNLRRKLDVLRREGGGQTEHESPAGKQQTLRELRSKIERMQVGSGHSAPAVPKVDDGELAALLQGEVVAPGVIGVETVHPAGEAYGNHPINAPAVLNAAAYFALSAHTVAGDVVFMDTETSGLAGGTGTIAFLVGLARFIGGAVTVRQFQLTTMNGESALLDAVSEWLTGASLLVTYNGKSFDAPLLNTRYRLLRRKDPFASLQHVDLLHIVRRAFGATWPDCRLARAERELLGVRRTDDIPGSEVPEVWFRWLRLGESHRLGQVLQHNCLDLLSLAGLLPESHHAYMDPIEHGANPLSIVKYRCVREDEAEVYRYLAAQRRRLNPPQLLELARLATRHRNSRLAVEIWNDLASTDNLQALESLAKHHEHRIRDLPGALNLTQRLAALQPTDPAHRHRQQRIARRLEKRRLLVSGEERGGG